MKLQITLLAFAIAACTPAVVPPSPDASDASSPSKDASPLGDAFPQPTAICDRACANLAALSCPAGSAPNCASTFAKVDQDRLLRAPNGKPVTCACLAAAGSAAAVVACGIPCP